jgi:endonuclease/exonuclease/phosphatase family metal-dependent hydrolase
MTTNEEILRVTGEPARVEHARSTGRPLRVVTWNIERGSAYDAVLSVLRRLNPDVALLQEVDQDCHRTGYRHVARDLAQALDMNWVAAGEFQELGEGRAGAPALTGQAILSRYPIHDAAGLRFQAQDRWRWSLNPIQPRRGGRMALKARTADVMVYTTHIESGRNERLQQRQMAEIVADQAAAGGGLPVIVAGDFNNRPPGRSLTLQCLTGASFVDALGDASGRGPTSRGRSHPIDWIFTKGLTNGPGRVADAQAASDHHPLVVEVTAPE